MRAIEFLADAPDEGFTQIFLAARPVVAAALNLIEPHLGPGSASAAYVEHHGSAIVGHLVHHLIGGALGAAIEARPGFERLPGGPRFAAPNTETSDLAAIPRHERIL